MTCARRDLTAVSARQAAADAGSGTALQHGLVVLPTSTYAERIVTNADLFDFTLSNREMETLDSLDEDLVTGWDPTSAP